MSLALSQLFLPYPYTEENQLLESNLYVLINKKGLSGKTKILGRSMQLAGKFQVRGLKFLELYFYHVL